MKRLLVMLLCVCVLALGAAHSEGATVSEGVRLTLDGQALNLSFDRSDNYSSVMNGNVQASFYTFTNGEENLYELYMVFPESVRTGDQVTPEYAIRNAVDSSVTLIITDNQHEAYYFASQVDDHAFPEGSTYDIRFDAVTAGGDGTRYEGRLSATFVRFEMSSGEALGSVQITDATFSFTMPDANRRSAAENPFDQPSQNPDDTPAPAPRSYPAETWRI